MIKTQPTIKSPVQTARRTKPSPSLPNTPPYPQTPPPYRSKQGSPPPPPLPPQNVYKEPLYQKNIINNNACTKSSWKSMLQNTKLRKNKSLNNLKNYGETNINNESNKKTTRSQQTNELNNSGTPKLQDSTRKSFRKKFSNLFRSNSLKSDKSVISNNSNKNVDKASQTLPCEIPKEQPVRVKSKVPLTNRVSIVSSTGDVALRNLSFTAAMMAKEPTRTNFEKLGKTKEEPSNQEMNSDINDKEDHTTHIPSSTLRFWRHPSQEKLKASARRLCDTNNNSSSEMLEKSMLSLFNGESGSGNTNQTGNVYVRGYDRALDRYHGLMTRQEKTRSVMTPGMEDSHYEKRQRRMSGGGNDLRSCTSSTSVNNILLSSSSSNPRIVDQTQDSNFISQSDLRHRSKSVQKPMYTKRQVPPPPPPQYLNAVQWRCKSPPSYEKVQSHRKSRTLTRPTSSSSTTVTTAPKSTQSSPGNPTVTSITPKPPPRSDSLLRSFELICHNLTTSITQPVGADSFKIFRSNSDYQAWLEKLPYGNPAQVNVMLRERSRQARRQCVSELIDDHHLILLNMRADSLVTTSAVMTTNIGHENQLGYYGDYYIQDSTGNHQTNLPLRRIFSWPISLAINSSIAALKYYQQTKSNDLTISSSDDNKRYSSLCRPKDKKQKINFLSNKFSSNDLESPSLNKYSRLYNIKKTPRAPISSKRKIGGGISIPATSSSSSSIIMSNSTNTISIPISQNVPLKSTITSSSSPNYMDTVSSLSSKINVTSSYDLT